MYFLLSVWTERINKKEPRTRSAVEQMGFPVSGCGTRGFAAQTVLARDDTEKPHLLPTAPAGGRSMLRPYNCRGTFFIRYAYFDTPSSEE